MPTYEYRCPNGHEFEKFFRTISASEQELVCPTCGAIAQRQVSAGAGLVFKGSGFYLTDYGKNAHANRGGTKSSSVSEPGSTKSDTTSKTGDAGAASTPKSGGGESTSSGDKSTPKKGD